MSPDHHKCVVLLNFRTATDVSNAVAGLTTLALNSDICLGMKKYIAGANLIPLEKVGGGIRSIAVGEVWRRLFAKDIMRSQAPAVRAYFEPLQLEVGTPLGSESVVPAAAKLIKDLGKSEE
jgi:hypothetical protein